MIICLGVLNTETERYMPDIVYLETIYRVCAKHCIPTKGIPDTCHALYSQKKYTGYVPSIVSLEAISRVCAKHCAPRNDISAMY